ncbi:MAG: DNA replication/repair protein RecF [Firmicutes bacterium]|nr:DNA replication/repair protein RecF [Bacillota bacterium]
MKINRIAVTNFLSYPRAQAVFGDSLNILSGKNATGKTNLADGVYYCSIGRSSRHNKDKELINWDSKTGARVTLTLEKRFSNHEIDIHIDAFGKKRILIDGMPIKRIGELMGVLNVVFFSPEEIKLIKESPQDRRRFLDISLSQQSKRYFYALVKYNKLLAQRNKVLKDYSGSENLKSLLNLIDPELIKNASLIIYERAKFLNELEPIAKAKHTVLTGGQEELALSYETEEVPLAEVSQIETAIKAVFEKNFLTDARREFTTAGAHRDDVKISANGIDLRKYGSQGQQRSAVLSLKLAEIALFKQRTGESPVLILDDVLSELDGARQTALLKATEGTQTIITATDATQITAPAKRFVVKDRDIYEQNP